MKYGCVFDVDERGRTRASLMEKDERISGLAIWHMPMRIGRAETLMGGIGGVFTHKDYRKRGLASIVMAESVAWMGENGFDLSVLFGIPDFYHRWGFIPVMSSSRVTVQTRYAEQNAPTCHPREYAESDLAAAMKLYNRDTDGRTATIVRRRKTWIPWRKGSQWGVSPSIFVYTRRRRVAAVAAFDLTPESVMCCDLAAPDQTAFAGIMKHASQLALERRVEKITFFIPRNHAFADFCREQGCELVQNAPRNGGAMARIINQNQLFGKLEDELARRLAASKLSGWSGTIDLVTDIEKTRLSVKSGKVVVAAPRGKARITLASPQSRLAQLLFGYQSIHFMLRHDPAVRLVGDKGGVINALFPRGFPYMYLPDHF